MKRLAFVLLLMTGSLLGSCQCSDPPEIPPIEEAVVESSAAAPDRA